MSMASATWPISPDPLADAVVPESVAHARTSRLVAQVVSHALTGMGVNTAERLGLRWPDGPPSAPDFFVMPGGTINWRTTSYAVGVDGPAPDVAVEIVGSSPPNLLRLLRRKVLTYLVSLDPPGVLRIDPAAGPSAEVPDGEPCPELGGIAFQRGPEGIGLLDPDGAIWWDPDEHFSVIDAERRALRRELDQTISTLDQAHTERDQAHTERDQAHAERDQIAAANEALFAAHQAALARLAVLEGGTS